MSGVSSLSSQLSANASAQFEARKAQRFAKLDQNGDGAISKDEFVAGRPKRASEAQASALYDKIDTQKSGALSQDQLQQGLEANRPQRSGQLNLSDSVVAALISLVQDSQNSASTSSTQSNASAKIKEDLGKSFDKADANQDGTVSQDEFVAARPDGVNAKDAEALYKSIDTQNTGALTKEQFIDGVKSVATNALQATGAEKGEHHGKSGGHGGGHGGPPPAKGGGESASTKSTTYEKEDLNKDGKVSDAEKLTAAITKAQEAVKEAAKAEAQKQALVANTVTSAYAAATKSAATSTVEAVA